MSSKEKGTLLTLAFLRMFTAFFLFPRLYGKLAPPHMASHDFLQLLWFSILLILCTFMFFGIYSRLSSFLLGAFTLVIYVSQTLQIESLLGFYRFGTGSLWREVTNFYAGHVAIILAMSPCGQIFSVDSLRTKSRPLFWQAEDPLMIFRGLILSVYFWAGISKLNAAFLKGEILTQAYIIDYAGLMLNDTSGPIFALFPVLSKAVVILELAIMVGLAIRRTRRIALMVGVAFHLSAMTFLPVAAFTQIFLATYLAFVDQEKLYRLFKRVTPI